LFIGLIISTLFVILVSWSRERYGQGNGTENDNDMEQPKHLIGTYNRLLLTENYHLTSRHQLHSS